MFRLNLVLFCHLIYATSVNCEIEGSRTISRDHLRFVRQTKPKLDPYKIAFDKCIKYAESRYVNKTIPSPLPNRPAMYTRKMECLKTEPLIAKGELAKLTEFPHMAVIGYSDQNNIRDVSWGCGGTLISDRYILTAAHCLKSGPYDARWVRLGELVIDSTVDKAKPKDFDIVEKIPHPNYTDATIYNDIMLFKLNQSVTFTPHMRPVCLYTNSIILSSFNNKALITGWGKTAADETSSDSLLKGKIQFFDNKECVNYYRSHKKLPKGYDPKTMICAGDKTTGVDTCQGDSGGPLQVPYPNWTCLYYHVGITSYGPFICGQKNVPAIYTKVSAYIPWIQQIVWPQ